MKIRIGLGLAALGRPGHINLGHAVDLEHNYSISAMRQRAFDVLDAAWNSGIRYFDVARSYGRAEEFLGSWIGARKIPSSEIQVGSKWGYTYTAAWKVQTPEGIAHEVKRHELSILKSQFTASFNQLSSHLDLYQIHSATLESKVLENKEVLASLLNLRQTGMNIGITVSGENQAATIRKATSIEFDGLPLFRSIQATWNLLETSAAGALAEAASNGILITVKESLANGRLTDKNDDPIFARQMALLQMVAAEVDSTVDALAIAVAIQQPWSNLVLSGAATVEHLKSNMRAESLNITPAIEERLADLVEPSTQYWNKRSALAWN